MPPLDPRAARRDLTWGDVAVCDTLDLALTRLDAVYGLGGHPYFRWLADPATTRDAFRRSQVPFRYAVEAFAQALAGVLAHMPRLEDRLVVAENLAEEHGLGQGASHKETFLEYLRALGADADELARPCPIWVTAFNHAIRNLCLAQPYECGAAALGVIEHLYVHASATIARAVVARGWVAPGSQRHYEVHEVLDVTHARELLDVARPAWDVPRTRAPVALGLLLGAHWFWRLYEDLLPADGAPVEPGGPPAGGAA